MFKISKLLSMLLGFAGFMRAGIVEEGGGGALDVSSAADAFSSFFDEPSSAEESGAAQAAEVTETPEAAAERLLQEDANQQSDAEGEQQPEVEAEDGTVEIEVDGKPVKLTKAELAEHYKNGLRQKDYTQKTMEAAEHRKAADAEVQKARAERENYAQQLTNFALTSESILAEQAKSLTEELLRSDPVEYMALERTFRQRQADLSRAQQELQRINGERQQEQTQQQAQYRAEQLEKLTEALPEWKDPKKATEEAGKIKNYLQDQGWTDADIGALADHRHVLAARKAMLYDSLMTRAKEAAGKVAKAPPKVERPGTQQVAPTDGRTTLMKQLKATGSKQVAAQLFENFV